MKRLLLFAAWAVAGAVGHAATVDLREFGQLSFVLDPAWQVITDDFGSSFAIDIVPKGEANANCEISIAYVPPDQLNSKAKLRSRMIEVCQPYAEESVERRVTPRELFMKSGYGYYADFTDPDLVGKPPQKGNYKVQTVAMVRLSDELGLTAVLMSDGFRELSHLQLLSAVESMELLPPAPAKK